MDEEYRAYGYEFPPIGTRLRQLEEGVQILKLMLSEKEVIIRRPLLQSCRRVQQSAACPETASADHDWWQRRKNHAANCREVCRSLELSGRL